MIISVPTFPQQSRFGISINSLTTNFNYGSSNKSLQPYKKAFKGLQIGTSYQAGISRMFSIVPEINFAIKGGALKANNPVAFNKLTLRIYTVETPVFARLHLKQFYINAGPYTAYTLGGRLKINGSEDLAGSSTKVSFGSEATELNRWDYGFQAGAGYNFKLKKSTLTLDARYGYGLASISNDINRYNRTLNISLVVSNRQKKSKGPENRNK
ncbi:MAG: hypothetical protein BGO21_21930 [Dyadobacter sp. 50-39]|nr:MAG: hypothetical protein BGO21_21930 [Dyadobacter sp. 50-39]